MKALLTFTLGLFALLTTAFAADPKVGDSVAAPWTNGMFYIATVTGISGDSANLLYEDGDKLTVPISKLLIISNDNAFKVGDRVLAAWKTAQMFPGVITAVTDVACTVKWEDGDTPMEVKKTRMVPLKK